MKKIPLLTLCIGAVLGSLCTLTFFWLRQASKISIIPTIAVTIIITAVVFFYCQVQKRAALKKAGDAYAQKLKKYQSYYYTFGSWMVLRNKKRTVAEYFENRNIKNVAICGLGRLGLCLYEELKNSNIHVKYAIDDKAESFSYLNLRVVSLESNLEAVDAIVVTKFISHIKTLDILRKKATCEILNLQDIISSM